MIKVGTSKSPGSRLSVPLQTATASPQPDERVLYNLTFSLSLFAEVPRNDTCPELPEVTNGWKTTSHPELVHGTVVTYQCYPGFEVVGTEMLMCQWDLTWSGDLPTCERGESCI